MTVYATPEFKEEYEKLFKNNSYKDFAKEIISSYFNKSFNQCLSGTRLNGNSVNPFIKKRIGGSGGGRLYLLAIMTKESIYFTFLSPKSGSAGSTNLKDEKIAELLENVYVCIQNSDLLIVTPSEDENNLIFTSFLENQNKSIDKFVFEDVRYYYEYEIDYEWDEVSDNELCIKIWELFNNNGFKLKDVYPRKEFVPQAFFNDQNIADTSTFIVENKMIKIEDAFSDENISHCLKSLQNNCYVLEKKWKDENLNRKYFVFNYKQN